MNPNGPNQAQWYCVRSKAKHEHIAAANLRRYCGLEVFSPRIQIRRARANPSSWVSEPLFPGYLFARFSLAESLDQLRHTSGVKSVVHFGIQIPVIPDSVVEEVRRRLEAVESGSAPCPFEPGDAVEVVDGPFRGLHAVVERYLPANHRVRILLEFLGNLASVEVNALQVTSDRIYPEVLLDEDRVLRVGGVPAGIEPRNAA